MASVHTLIRHPKRLEDRFPSLFATGYAKLPDEVCDYGSKLGMTPNHLLVITALWRHQSRGGVARPSHSQLRRETWGLGISTIKRTLADLEARGLLVVTKRAGRPSEYDLAPFLARLADLAHGGPGSELPSPERAGSLGHSGPGASTAAGYVVETSGRAKKGERPSKSSPEEEDWDAALRGFAAIREASRLRVEHERQVSAAAA